VEEEKLRQQKAAKALLDESLKMKREVQMKQEQEELAFDRKILEQLLEQSQAEQLEQAQRKVSKFYPLPLPKAGTLRDDSIRLCICSPVRHFAESFTRWQHVPGLSY